MSVSPEKKGQYYRYVADATTYARNGLGVLVAVNALSGDRLLPKTFRYRSVGSGILVAAIGGLDKLDGHFAAKAQSYNVPIMPENSAFDSDMDKKNNKVLAYCFAARNLVEGVTTRNTQTTTHAAVIAGYALWTNNRDDRMAKSRSNAAVGADTRAIKPNKYKTLAQNTGHALEASPLSAIAPELVEITYLASCVLGEVGLKIADKIHQLPIVTEMALVD